MRWALTCLRLGGTVVALAIVLFPGSSAGLEVSMVAPKANINAVNPLPALGLGKKRQSVTMLLISYCYSQCFSYSGFSFLVRYLHFGVIFFLSSLNYRQRDVFSPSLFDYGCGIISSFWYFGSSSFYESLLIQNNCLL